MKCEKCGKSPATTHLTQIINGIKAERYLCSKCVNSENSLFDSLFADDLDVLFPSFFQKNIQPAASAACPSCKSSLDDIRRLGRLGCSDCYTTFRQQLAPTIEKLHGANRHIGLTPKSIKPVSENDNKIRKLKQQLKKAVSDENYEEAARLRDEIRSLEK